MMYVHTWAFKHKCNSVRILFRLHGNNIIITCTFQNFCHTIFKENGCKYIYIRKTNVKKNSVFIILMSERKRETKAVPCHVDTETEVTVTAIWGETIITHKKRN